MLMVRIVCIDNKYIKNLKKIDFRVQHNKSVNLNGVETNYTRPYVILDYSKNNAVFKCYPLSHVSKYEKFFKSAQEEKMIQFIGANLGHVKLNNPIYAKKENINFYNWDQEKLKYSFLNSKWFDVIKIQESYMSSKSFQDKVNFKLNYLWSNQSILDDKIKKYLVRTNDIKYFCCNQKESLSKKSNLCLNKNNQINDMVNKMKSFSKKDTSVKKIDKVEKISKIKI